MSNLTDELSSLGAAVEVVDGVADMAEDGASQKRVDATASRFGESMRQRGARATSSSVAFSSRLSTTFA